MLKSAGYSDDMARSLDRRRRERLSIGIPELGFHAHHPENCSTREEIASLADAARSTDPRLRQSVTDRILNSQQ